MLKMNNLLDLTNQLIKEQKIKEFANLILDKNKLIENFIETNFLIKFDTITYKKFLINKMNEKINEKFTNFKNFPPNLKKVYFPNNNQGQYQDKIRDLIDEIVYPSIYDYRTKNVNEMITLAIQLNNNYSNSNLMIPIFILEQAINAHMLTKNQNLNFDLKSETTNINTFLNYQQIEDLCKRIIF